MKNRFWDYYLVRYLAPTALGMLIIFYIINDNKFLLNTSYCQYHEILLQFRKTRFDIFSLIIWGIFGFLYMYISSSFILFLHAIRLFPFIKNFNFFSTVLLLAKKRVKNEKNKDFVETYRHLREHGNAFGIMFFEIMLLLVWSSFGYSILLIIFLFLLGFSSWCIATYLEIKFITND